MPQTRVLAALRHLVPYDVPGIGKLRLGGPHDGGYVMLDALAPSQTVLSFGVGPTVTFDADMAERGHDVLLFDHTVDALPQSHPRFRWFRQGVAGQPDPAADLYTLPQLMRHLPRDAVNPILKMDVEGAEWDALGLAPRTALRRFSQIVLEFHTLFDLPDPAFNRRVVRALSRLARDFAVVHVHGNNWGKLGLVAGMPLPETLEVTYARRDLFVTAPSSTFYPTEYDTPNCDFRPDFPLWFYPFHPG